MIKEHVKLLKERVHTFAKKVKAFEEKLANVFAVLAKLVAIASGMLILISSLKGILQENYTIEPFEVPEAFFQNGVTGAYITQRINDEVIQIRKDGWSVHGLSLKSKDEEEIKNDVVVFGLSLNSVKSLLRESLGISNKTISGNIVTKGDRLEISFSISGGESVVLGVNINDFSDVYYAAEHLISDISKALLKEIDPFILASYFWSKQETSKSIAIIQLMLAENTHSGDSAYLLWGEILSEQNEQELAIEKIEQGLEINDENALLWTALATIYFQEKNYDLALEKIAISIDVDDDIWTTWFLKGSIMSIRQQHHSAINYFERALKSYHQPWQLYNDLSYEYADVGDLPKAIQILKKGIQFNPSEPVLFATLAEKYWRMNEEEKAYKAIKDAIGLGFSIEQYKDVSPYKEYLNKNLR